jgi:hypothetical protein
MRLNLIIIFLLLFTSQSFNAYACLVPVFGTPAALMGNGCALPEQQAARHFCDGFKILSIQSGGELDPRLECQTVSSEDTASLSLLLRIASTTSPLNIHHVDVPPQDVLLKISVLRI